MNNDQAYYNLSYSRSKQSESDELRRQADLKLKPPSGLFYGAMFSLSIIGDIIDIADVTGVGAILSFIVDLIISVFMILTGRIAKSKTDSMQDFKNSVADKMEQVERKISAYRNAYAGVLRASRKIGPLRKPVRKMALQFSRFRKSVVRSPFSRTILAVVADLVPFLGLVPWRTWNTYSIRRDELMIYNETKKMLSEYENLKQEEVVSLRDLRELESLQQNEG
ncbi:MAG TPA: hypothetical protein VJH71_00395 [Candidatus Paceibacterota bacterium]